MNRILKQHWKTLILQFIAVGVIVVFVFHSLPSKVGGSVNPGSATPSIPPVSPSPSIDLKTYKRMQQLRQRLALTSQDLASAGCTQSQATAILSNLLNWEMLNAQMWDQQELSRQSVRQSLADAVRKVNVGPSDSALMARLPELQQAVAKADQQFDQFFQAAMDVVSPQLNPVQQQLFLAARVNSALGIPDSFRYVPGLTADRARVISLARSRAGGTDPAGIVDVSGMAQIKTTADECSAGVLAAESSVLPIPLQP